MAYYDYLPCAHPVPNTRPPGVTMKLAIVLMLCAAMLAQPGPASASWIECASGTLTVAGDFYRAAINPDGTMNVSDTSGSVLLIGNLGSFEGRYTSRHGETTSTTSGVACVTYVETQPGAKATISTQLRLTGPIPPAPPIDLNVALDFTVEKASPTIVCTGRLKHNVECEVDQEAFLATVQDMPTNVYRRDGTWGLPIYTLGGGESGWWPQGTEGHAPTCAAWSVAGLYPVQFWGAPDATSNWLTMPCQRYEETSGSIEYAGAWSSEQQTSFSEGWGTTSTTPGSTATLTNRTGARWIQAWARRSASDDSALTVRLKTDDGPFADVRTVDLRARPANISPVSTPAVLLRNLDPAAAYSIRMEPATSSGVRLDCFDVGGTTRVVSCIDSAVDTGQWSYYPYYEGVGTSYCELSFGSLTYGGSGWQFVDGASVDTSKYYGHTIKLAADASLSTALDFTITVKTQSGSTKTFDWSYPAGTTAVRYLGETTITAEYAAVHKPRVLKTTSTAALAVGDWVYVSNGSRVSPLQVTRIVSVDGPTQVTLQDPPTCGGGPSNGLRLVPLFTDVLACASASPGSSGRALSFKYNAVYNSASPTHYKLCKQKHIWAAGSEASVELVFSAGASSTPLVKAYAPYGYDSVLCLTEHADAQTPVSSIALVRGSSSPSAPEYDTKGFAARRLPFTKTIFDRQEWDTIPPYALRNTADTAFTSFKDTLDYMHGQGFEIGLHTARLNEDYPDGVHSPSVYLEPALDRGRQLYDMKCWIDHGMRANREGLSSSGFRGGFISPTTPDTADLLLDHGFRTAWAEPGDWRAAGALASAKLNVLCPGSELDMGYQLPRTIFPTFWSNPDVGGARYRQLGLMSTVLAEPYTGQLAPSKVDALIADRGVCILHEYFSRDCHNSGWGADPYTMTWTGDVATIAPTFSAHLDAIAARRDAGKVWVADVSDFWDYVRARDAVRIEPLDGSRYRITNTGADPICGLTLYAPVTSSPAAQARLDGVCMVRVGKSFNAQQQWVGQTIILPPLAPGQVSILDVSGSAPAGMPTVAPSGVEPSYWATWDADALVTRLGSQNPYFPGTQETYNITCPAYANKDVRVVATNGSRPADAAVTRVGVGSDGTLACSFERDRVSNDLAICTSRSISDARRVRSGSLVCIEGEVAISDKDDFSDFFYVEASDRSSGIRIAVPPASVEGLRRGSQVDVVGTLSDTGSGERQITDAVVSVRSTL